MIRTFFSIILIILSASIAHAGPMVFPPAYPEPKSTPPTKTEIFNMLVASSKDSDGNKRWNTFVAALRKEHPCNKIDLANTDLNQLNLERADLRQADLQGSTMYKTNLRGANLTDAQLHNASLIQADLSYATLRSAQASFTTLISADLTHTDLQGADLEGSDLTGANLTDTFLHHTNLSRTTLYDATITQGLMIGTNSFYGAKGLSEELQEAILRSLNASWSK